ncbi:MAG: hypothetical protein PHU12_04545, partial [Candidatus Aenigmarchaeota archaeon]|nr:hypothetical protein [Candidatus Aenigmarchaeota archaeon]
YANVINENADEVRSGNAIPNNGFDILFFLLFMIVFFVPLLATIITRVFTAPKCNKCKCRMKLVKQETITEKKKGAFGIIYDVHYSLNTYRCPKCDCTIIKKVKMRSGVGPIVFFGGGHGGGFSGGFGGGGFGGGGAGR